MGYSKKTPIYRMNKHLNEFERTKIQVLCSLGYPPYRIAKIINISANTVRNGLNSKISSNMCILFDNFFILSVFLF